MYEDLEAIANLKYGQVVEEIAKEGRADLSAKTADLASRGLANSGPMISARLNSALQTSERSCRAIYQIWLELILQRNKGKLSREDIAFIMAKVNPCVEARSAQIASALPSVGQGPAPQWAIDQGRSKLQSLAGVIHRELEIKFREQEAFREDKRPLEAGFGAFLRSFGESWLTLMSGPLTVPFAVATIFVPGLYKLLFGALAIVSGVFSSYRVWRNERERVNAQR
jgi:hypothetical protein